MISGIILAFLGFKTLSQNSGFLGKVDPSHRSQNLLSVSKDSKIEYRRKPTIYNRLQFWQNTIDMIVDNPLGIGSRNFEFTYLPYTQKSKKSFSSITEIEEGRLLDSPHNGFLRLLVEYGVIWFAAVFGAIALLLWKLFRSKEILLRNKHLVFSFFTFLSIEMMFQFPLDLPWGKFFLALMVGYLLAQLFSPCKIRLRWFHRLFVAFALMILVVSSIVQTVSWHRDFKQEQAEIICPIDSSNWRYCIHNVFLNLRHGKIENAKKGIVQLIRLNPHNVFALKQAAFLAERVGEEGIACEAIKVVYTYFGGHVQGDTRALYNRRCKERMKLSSAKELISARSQVEKWLLK